MFCPHCRTEYVNGVVECSDCHAQLVKELPKQPSTPLPDYIEYVEVLKTYNPVDIAIIQSILGEQHIDFFFQGETFNQLEPTAQPVRLMVRENQASVVKTLLKDMEIRFLIPFK